MCQGRLIMLSTNVENKINIGIDVIDKCQAGNCDIDEFLEQSLYKIK